MITADDLLVVAQGVFALVALLVPGLWLAARLGAADEPSRWLLYGSCLSQALLVPLLSVLHRAEDALDGMAAAGLGAVSVALALWWLLRQRAAPWRALLPTALPLLTLLLLLAGKLREGCNPDGVHAYATARLLWHTGSPFFGTEYGALSGFPGVTSMLFAYPAAWFVALGLDTAGPRLAFFLQLLTLHAGCVALAQTGAGRRLGWGEQLALWCGLSVYTVVMAFSATYSPYSADLAMPGAQDTQLMAVFLGFLVAWQRGQRGLMALCALLTYLALPNGLLLLVGWSVLAVLLQRPRPWRMAVTAAAVVLGCVVLGALLPGILTALKLPAPGSEYDSLRQRFRFVLLDDWRRLLWLVVPCGAVPAVALLWWPRRDRTATALALLTLGYFALFYGQAYVALHHFVPVFVLPLLVLWRSVALAPARPVLTVATALVALCCGWASLPAHPTPHTAPMEVGALIEDRLDRGGERRVPTPARARAAEALYTLFPVDMDERVPEQLYGGSCYAWQQYARDGGRTAQTAPAPRYVLQADQDPPPAGGTLLGKAGGGALYTLDPRFPDEDRSRIHPPTSADHPLYVIDRDLLFKRAHRKPGSHVIDLAQVLKRWGLAR